jgi:hypothetical protein
MSRAFDVVVSIGQNCQAAYQISREFYQRGSGPFDWGLCEKGAHFFDWLICDGDAAISLIRNDFAGFLRPDALVFVEEPFPAVVETTYGVKIIHDFPQGNRVNEGVTRP